MTNGEVIVNFIKETFPDLVKAVEDDGKQIIDPDDINICDFINCGDCSCRECGIDQAGLSCSGTWSANEYQESSVSNDTKVAITSGEISW